MNKDYGLRRKIYLTLPLWASLSGVLAAASNPASVAYVDHQDSVLQTQIDTLKADGMTTYTVGQEALGGIVFYVDSTGTHGLVASTHNNNSDPAGVTWRGYTASQGAGVGAFITNAIGNGLGAGAMNTSLIVSELSLYSTTQASPVGNFAAKVCSSYCIGADGTTACSAAGTGNTSGYADWYLPSLAELTTMWRSGAVSLSGSYWSSTEISGASAPYDAWSSSGSVLASQSSSPKYTPFKVRCIRSF